MLIIKIAVLLIIAIFRKFNKKEYMTRQEIKEAIAEKILILEKEKKTTTDMHRLLMLDHEIPSWKSYLKTLNLIPDNQLIRFCRDMRIG